MIKLIIQKKIFLYLAIIISSLYSNRAFSQCTWVTQDFDDFEGAMPIPYVDASLIYGSGTHSAGAYNGGLGLWLNVQNGFPAQLDLYSRPYTVCPGHDYQFTAWIGGTAGSDYTAYVYDGTNISGTPIAIYNSFSTWVFQTIGSITPTTSTLTFVIRNNIAGGIGSNDFQMDDLSLQLCVPDPTDNAIFMCSSSSQISLFDSLPIPMGTAGVWTGPSVLSSGSLGYFDPALMTDGTYTYTVLGVGGCPDSTNTVTTNVTSGPNLTTTNIVLSCGNNTADITTSFIDNNTSGGSVTYWQDASASILEPNPTNITTAGTYYIVMDAAGCSDTASVTVSIQAGATINLGNDTSFCSGQSITLDATTGFDHYLWNDNSTNQTLTASTAGTFWVEASTLGTNLVSNGDFTLGNTGFGTDYTVGTGGTWGPISNPGTYLVTTNANLAHNNFSSCTDHTTGTGNMMVVNGASIANQNVWCQTIAVTANTDYEFSTWIQNYDLPNPAQLSFFINGLQIGATFSPTTAGCPWQNFFELWNSGVATSAQICIVNQSLAGGGNDFAIDDISFSPLCTATDTIIITINPGLTIDLGPDIDTCQGLSATLDATTAAATYSWQDASTNPTFNATNSGLFWVDVTANGCTGRDSINVNFSNDISISDSIFNISCFGGNNGEIHLFGDTAEITIYPEADSYTYEFGATNNYGSNTTLLVHPDWPASGGTEENYTYLRYDLSSIPTGSILVGTELEMTAFRGWANGGNGNCYTQFVADDSWQENTINYNNQPISSGTNIGFWWLWYNNTPGIQVGNNSDPALNTQTATEFAGDQKISFQLHSLGYETEYFSRESTDQTQHPKLTIKYLIPYTYNWSGPNGYTGATNPITNLEGGVYNVTITNPENCTLDTFYTITEPPILTLDLDSTDASCGSNDGYVLATVTGGTQTYSYLWSTNTSAGDTNFVDNLGVDLYLLTVTDSNGCTASDSINITTNSSQNGIDNQTACNSFTWSDNNTYTTNNSSATDTIFGGANNGCDSIITLNLTITNATNGIDTQTACNSFTWSNNNTYTTNNSTATDTIFGGSSNGCDSIITLNLTITNTVYSIDIHSACANYTWIDGNNYISNNNTATFAITGGSFSGCDSIATLDLTISPNITINLGEDLYICEETVTITPGLGYSTYLWDDGTNNSSLITDIYGIYTVTVVDIDGCTGSDEIELIKGCPANIWVPNVFSPNGDSKNETFNAVGDNLTGFSLKIFNRWGNLLFETNSIGNGWDGTHKGSKVSSGTYVYLIEYSYTEKRNTINKNIKGTVTLLK